MKSPREIKFKWNLDKEKQQDSKINKGPKGNVYTITKMMKSHSCIITAIPVQPQNLEDHIHEQRRHHPPQHFQSLYSPTQTNN